MDVLFQGSRRVSRSALHCLNRAPQTRPYTKESLNRLRHRRAAGNPSRTSRTPTAPSPKSKRPRVSNVKSHGKLRNPSSNAAKAERFKESRRVEKALKHEHHGENVYAYVHIRTGQVVYSLTRVMNNNQILSQLVFHGKKTVPAALRRDMWTPYFSLHFPSGYSGLLAYHRLCELSSQRQLAPPDYLITRDKQTASKERRAMMTREEEEKWDKENEGKPYADGLPRMMPRRDRARSLMMQRATSVADVAFTVDLLQREGHLLSPRSVEELLKMRKADRLETAGKGPRKKLRAAWRMQEAREQRYKVMVTQAQEGVKWGLEKYAAKRIAREYGGAVVNPSLGQTRVMLPAREAGGEETERSDGRQPDTTSGSPLEVRILWADLRDAAYAEKWAPTVSHGELERFAGSGRVKDRQVVRTHLRDRSVHVIGGMKMGGDHVDWGMGQSRVRLPSRKRRSRLDGGDANDAAKSREEQTQQLEKEGVVVEPRPSTGVLSWVKGRLGMAA